MRVLLIEIIAASVAAIIIVFGIWLIVISSIPVQANVPTPTPQIIVSDSEALALQSLKTPKPENAEVKKLIRIRPSGVITPRAGEVIANAKFLFCVQTCAYECAGE